MCVDLDREPGLHRRPSDRPRNHGTRQPRQGLPPYCRRPAHRGLAYPTGRHVRRRRTGRDRHRPGLHQPLGQTILADAITDFRPDRRRPPRRRNCDRQEKHRTPRTTQAGRTPRSTEDEHGPARRTSRTRTRHFSSFRHPPADTAAQASDGPGPRDHQNAEATLPTPFGEQVRPRLTQTYSVGTVHDRHGPVTISPTGRHGIRKGCAPAGRARGRAGLEGRVGCGWPALRAVAGARSCSGRTAPATRPRLAKR